jgi:hypothetical protein
VTTFTAWPPGRNHVERIEFLLAELGRKNAYLSNIRQTLRLECAEYDDNDWPDNLHLSDVIEKHLARSARNEIDHLTAELERVKSVKAVMCEAHVGEGENAPCSCCAAVELERVRGVLVVTEQERWGARLAAAEQELERVKGERDRLERVAKAARWVITDSRRTEHGQCGTSCVWKQLIEALDALDTQP